MKTTGAFKKLGFFMLAMCLAVPSIYAQSPDKNSLPAPYEKGEFSPWAHGLRRFEIMALGSFPLLFMYVKEAHEIFRYANKGFSPEYSPWPFRPPNAIPFTKEEQWANFLAAGALSLFVASLDAIILWRLSLD